MKLSSIIMMLGVLQVSATSYGQRIDLNMEPATLVDVFEQIKVQTGYEILCDASLIKAAPTKDVDFKNADIGQVLEAFFPKMRFGVTKKDRTIIIRRLPTAEVSSTQRATEPEAIPPVKISGAVVDSVTGQRLAGVSIKIRGTNAGTVTDVQGRFELEVPDDAVLEISYLGYLSKAVAVNGATSFEIKLVATSTSLNQMVVVGYGTQKKRDITTAISHFDGEKMKEAPVNSVADFLKGKMPGVRVTTTDFQPGSTPRFIIRGGSSINGSNNPIVLVDGVERDFTGLNPNDIKSIEVLKDAASANIYGSRASNGVILVTTKKGSSERRAQVTFSTQAGIQEPATRFNLMNAREYLETLRPALAESLYPDVLNSVESAGIGNGVNSIWTPRYLKPGEKVPSGWESMVDPVNPSRTIIFQDNDQQRQWFRRTHWTSSYLGIQGGSDQLNYYSSLGFTDDGGVGVNTDYSALTFHGGTTYKAFERLTITSSFDYYQTRFSDFPGNKRNTVIRGLFIPPTHRDYYENGEPALGVNNTMFPAAFYKKYYSDRDNTQKRTNVSLKLDWNILDGLNAIAQITKYNRHTNSRFFMKANPITSLRETGEGFSQTDRIDVQAYLNYKKSFKEVHNIELLGGYDYLLDKEMHFDAKVTGAPSDKVTTLTAGTESSAGYPSSRRTSEVLISYFGRANYSLMDRYLLNFSIRTDGSSKFADGNRWGVFPAASLGWIVSNEAFWGANSSLNFLKMRASYGITGNNSIGLNDAYGSYRLGVNYNGNSTVLYGDMPNLGLQWETTRQINLGLDVGFLNDRIQASLDVYDKHSKNLLFNVPVPIETGFNSIIENVGQVRFYGFDFQISGTIIANKNFRWTSEFNYSYVKNRVVKLPDNGNPKNRIGGILVADGSQFGGIAEGEPLGQFTGYKVDYIIETQAEADNALYDVNSLGFRRDDPRNVKDDPSLQGRKDIGDYEWIDRPGSSLRDGNPMINEEDQFVLGHIDPRAMGGFSNTFSYKNFSLDIILDYALGYQLYDRINQYFFKATMGNANLSLSRDLLNAWKKPGDKTKYARFTANDSDWGNRNYGSPSDVFVKPGDYLSIRDIKLTYSIPDGLVSKIGISNMSLWVSGHNLHYFTAIKGVSPEAISDGNLYKYMDSYNASYNPYPPERRILFGINVTF